MTKVEVFCTPFCPYCVRAKRLLENKNVEYEEIRVDQSPERHDEMIKRSNRTSVPQIFIDDVTSQMAGLIKVSLFYLEEKENND